MIQSAFFIAKCTFLMVESSNPHLLDNDGGNHAFLDVSGLRTPTAQHLPGFLCRTETCLAVRILLQYIVVVMMTSMNHLKMHYI